MSVKLIRWSGGFDFFLKGFKGFLLVGRRSYHSLFNII
jgi:hypothetical protein